MKAVLLYLILVRRYDTPKFRNVIFQTTISRKPLLVDMGYDT